MKLRHLLFLMLAAALPTALMADENVNITANDQEVVMPVDGTTNVTVAEGVTTFYVFDNGGQYGDYANYSNSTLNIICPTGYVMLIEGTVNTENGYDKLTIKDSNGTPFSSVNAASGSFDVNEQTSSNSASIVFTSDGSVTSSGYILGITIADRNHLPAKVGTVIYSYIHNPGSWPAQFVVTNTVSNECWLGTYGYSEASDPRGPIGSSLEGEYTIPETVVRDGVTYTVTGIAPYAFSNCRNLTKVNIPSTVKYIGSLAFEHCTSLTSAYIPASVTDIETNPFRGCTALESITVDENNTWYRSSESNAILTIGQDLPLMLKGKTKKVWSPEDYDILISGCKNTVIPTDRPIMIGSSAFAYQTGITSITLPANVEDLYGEAFRGCNSLTDIYVENPSLYNCLGSTSTFESLTVDYDALEAAFQTDPFDMSAYYDAYNSSEWDIIFNNATVHVPAGTRSDFRNEYAWNRFENIVSNGIEEGDIVAIDVPLNDGTTKLLVTGLGIQTGVDMTTGEEDTRGFVAVAGKNDRPVYAEPMAKAEEAVVTTGDDVPDYGFYRAVDPAAEGELTIPTSFTYNGIEYYVVGIDQLAFANCDKLTKINLPESLYYIDHGAFYFNKALQSLHIPAMTEMIEADGMFIGCESLESITVDEANAVYDSRDNANAIIQKASASKGGGIIAVQRHLAKKVRKADIEPIDGDDDEEDEDIALLVAGCKNTVVPESVKAIGDMAFAGLTTLKTITIPESVEAIGDGAFMGALNLRQIIMKSPTPPEVARYAFEGTMEGMPMDDAQEFIETTIENGMYAMNDDPDREPIDEQAKAQPFFAKKKAAAKAKREETADPSTGIPEDYNDHSEDIELDPQVYQHAALCVPTGAKAAYSEFWIAEAKAEGVAKAAPADNENYWAWFTHIIEPTVIPASGVVTFTYDDNYDLPADVAAYIVTNNNEDGEGNPYVSVDEVSGTIPAGTAILVKGEAGTEFYVIPADTETETADVSGNVLVAVTETESVDKTDGNYTNYVLNADGEFVPANGDTVEEGSAYMQIPTSEAPEDDKPIVIDWDGSIADAIHAVTNGSRSLDNAAIYDLNGRRIGTVSPQTRLPKGIYVINGRKVIIK